MEPRITLLTIGVDNLERALTFYRDGLGLPTKGIVGQALEHGAVVFFDLHGGLKLALWERRNIAHDAGLPQSGRGPTEFTIAHNVHARSEVDVVMAQAAAAGATIVKPAAETFWGGYTGYFSIRMSTCGRWRGIPRCCRRTDLAETGVVGQSEESAGLARRGRTAPGPRILCDVSGLLEASDLAGPVTAAPAIVRLAPAPIDVADLLRDESRLTAAGVASLAQPSTCDELRQVLRWHALEGHAVTVSGARTGVAGGAVPDPSTHLVSVARLRGVIAIDLAATPATVRVLAGTPLRELQGELAEKAPGWALPLDPTEAGASVGGMVATNAAGARGFRFGATRDWVVGLNVELASGRTLQLARGRDTADRDTITLAEGDDRRTVRLGAIPKPGTKHAIGYAFVPGGDIVDLFIGSEGTLGVVSDVTFRLLPVTESRLAFLQCLATPDQAFALVEALRNDSSTRAGMSGLTPCSTGEELKPGPAGVLRTSAIEFLDARSHALALETGKPEVARVLARAPAGSCSVFAEFGYDDEGGLERTIARVLEHVATVGGDPDAGLAGIDEQVLHDIRVFRHAVPERINATIARRREQHPGLHKIATDMAVEDKDLRWVYDLYSTRLTAANLDHAIFGHAGNNHFHVNILPKDEAELYRAKAIYREFARTLVARGGCVSAEHGLGRIKKAFLPMQYDAATLEVMRAIKGLFDPEWRLNPGVLIDP